MCSSITRRLDLTLLVFVPFPSSYSSQCIQRANTYQPYLEVLLTMRLPRPSAHCQARGEEGGVPVLSIGDEAMKRQEPCSRDAQARVALSNRNTTQATNVILGFLVMTLKKVKWKRDINFNNMFYLFQ